jgi:Dolichyl-phosphate-mannose-protein mannosyltransferase
MSLESSPKQVAAPDRRSHPCVPRARLRAWHVLLGLVALSAVLRLLAALDIPSPWITPDEETYAALGRSLYDTGRFEVLGRSVDFLSLLYPAVAGVPLSLFGPERGYAGVKVVQAVLASLTAVPVYLWGRSLMGRGWALAAAGLTVAIPGLAYSGFVMTEILFYCLVVVSAWAVARALARPTLDAQALAVGTLLLAMLTRFQAVALVPAFVLALLLKLRFERAPLRGLRPFAPSLLGLAALAAGWVVFQRTAGTGGGVLGSYALVGRVSYDPGEVALFILYHLADLALLVALFPLVALVILTANAVAGRERSEDARAFLAVTVAYVLAFAVEVGLFTSRLTDRIGERYLLGLAPLLFLAFGLWLQRGLPRPRIVAAAAAAAVLALVAAFPFGRFVVEAAAPDAPSLIPLYRLREALLGSQLRLAAILVAAGLVVLLVIVPRRLGWVLPAIAFGLLAAASVSASRFLASQGDGYAAVMVGPDKTWIDRSANAPVGFLYAGEYPWSGGGPAWVNTFWNRRIKTVYNLSRVPIYGPLPRTRVHLAADGGLLDPRGRRIAGPYLVTATGLTLDGERVAQGGTFALWRLDGPARVSSRSSGIRLTTGDIDSDARLTAYGCQGGALELDLVVPEARRIQLFRDGQLYRTLRLRAGQRWLGRVPAGPGRRMCTFRLLSFRGGVHANRFEFVRPG